MENSTDSTKSNNNSEDTNLYKPTTIKKDLNPAELVDKPSTSKKDANTTELVDKSSTPKKDVNPTDLVDKPTTPKKPAKPPKIEDKPFDEFITKYFIPELKKSIINKGSTINEIKLINGIRPVVGGRCWMVFCELGNDRKFWLCFNKDIITSDKTILLAESNTEPSIVESFLIDEKKITLQLLISRVLQRLNGQKWIGSN